MPNKILSVRHLELFDPLKKRLLKNVNFEIMKGESVHLKGENGLGKTALLRSIFSDYKKKVGEIDLLETNFSYLPQLSAKRPKLPVKLEAICDKEFPFYGTKTMKRPLNGASGGERKRAMLARVFSEKRPLIVLDEPLNHLDSEATSQVSKWLQDYVDGGGTLIYTGHVGDLPASKTVDLQIWKS